MPVAEYSVPPSQVFRTPDSRFDKIPEFPYKPRYGHMHGGLRYAFIDEVSGVLHGGKQLTPEEASKVPAGDIHWETYLCLHGQPTWSYLYRRMIPVFLSHTSPGTLKYVRRRVIAPDFIGFGRSDKPIEDDFYTWDMHLDFLTNCASAFTPLITTAELSGSSVVRRHVVDERPNGGGDVIGVVQGGILGLTLPAIFPKLFSHLLVMNTALGLGRTPSRGWLAFYDYIQRNPDVNVGALISRGVKHLTAEEVAAYDAPHPDYRSKAGVRRFPPLVPREPSMDGVASSYAALAFYNHLSPSQLRVFVAMGLADPVLPESSMESLITTTFAGVGCFVHKSPAAGHFVQEWGGLIAKMALDAWSLLPRGKEGNVEIEGVEWRAPKLSSNARL